MMEYFSEMPVPANLHVGVTVESSAYKSRIDSLRQIDAGIRFLSCEPLLDDLGEVDLTGIHWVIVGGESGPGARRMKPEWVRSLYSQAKERNIPFFFKQWGAWGPDGVLRDKKRNGSLLDGEIVQMVPEEIRS
jgi:protein gp37